MVCHQSTSPTDLDRRRGKLIPHSCLFEIFFKILRGFLEGI